MFVYSYFIFICLSYGGILPITKINFSLQSFNWTPSAAKVKSILNSCDAVHAERDKTVMSLSASSYTTPGKFSPLIDRSMQGEFWILSTFCFRFYV